jgi:hypothetical protein
MIPLFEYAECFLFGMLAATIFLRLPVERVGCIVRVVSIGIIFTRLSKT